MMKIVTVKTKKEKQMFMKFRDKIYSEKPNFIDNNSYLLDKVFYGNTIFLENKEVSPLFVLDDNNILCECIAIYAADLPEYIQLCFFESLENENNAVKLLIDKVIKIGKDFGCKKIVVSMNGHVNYGLGMLADHFTEKNSFGASINPDYYNNYFKNHNFNEIFLNTYLFNKMNEKAIKYSSVIKKIDKKYTFKFLDKKQLDYFTQIYTDINNACFAGHKYYYRRKFCEDKEMLKELLLFIKPDSLIFAFKDDVPVGFVLWYPDFNELVGKNEKFGAKTFIKNKIFGRKIKKGKIVEIAVLDEHKKTGLAVGLVNQAYLRFKKYGLSEGESSWVLAENTDSNSLCKAVCDGLYKRYVIYEKEI